MSSAELPSTNLETIDNDTLTYLIVDKSPRYKKGEAAFQNFARHGVSKDRLQGKRNVFIQLTIDKSGDPIKTKVLNNTDSSLQNLIKKNVIKAGKWIPGEHDNKKVKVRLVIPVTIY